MIPLFVRILSASLSLAWLSMASIALSDTAAWINPDGGDFGDPTNWFDNTVPGMDMFADISLGGTYQINLDTDRTIQGLHVAGTHSDVTLDLGGYTLTTSSSSTSGGTHALHVRGVEDETGVLRVHNGILEAALSRIGQSRSGEVVVENGGVLRMSKAVTSRVGDNNGTGKIYVGEGGLLEVESDAVLEFGVNSGHGYLEVRGTTARVNASGAVNVAVLRDSPVQGEILVTDGAEAAFDVLHVGRNTGNLGGRLEVSEGATLTARQLRIGRDDGNGYVRVASGADIDVLAMWLGKNSVLEIDDAMLLIRSTTTRVWEEGSIYRLHLNAVDATPLSLNHIEIASTLEVHLGENFVAELGNVYTVMEYSGVLDGYFRSEDGSLLEDGDQIVIGGHVFDLHYGGRTDGGIVGLELVAIPEPGQVALWISVFVLTVAMRVRSSIRCRYDLQLKDVK